MNREDRTLPGMSSHRGTNAIGSHLSEVSRSRSMGALG